MIQFHHQKELQNFVAPVLKIRAKSLENIGIHMTDEEIFEHLKNKKWKYQKNLHIYEIVEDILNFKIEKKVEKKNETIQKEIHN